MNMNKYEEKYKEALERAREWYNNPNSSNIGKSYLYAVFPELKENENNIEELTDFEKAFQGMCCDKNKQFVKECCKTLLELAKKQCCREVNNTDEDVIKSKFKVGDWVVKGDIVAQILDIQEQYYIGIDIKGNDFTSSKFLSNNKIHLWTLQDAKPGDILAFDDNNIVMFKNLYNATTFHSYCHIEDGLFGVNNDEMPDWWEGEGFHPATKEQRNILFQKMHEAGHEWDSNEKELNKIDDEEYNGEDYGIDSLYHAERILEKTLGEVDGYQTDDGILEHKCAITAVKKLYEQKPTEWSEEDETKIKSIITFLKSPSLCAMNGNKGIIDENIKYLKSLKDRVQPKPKQEWKQENRKELTEFENAMMHIGRSFFEENAGLDPNDTATIKEQAKLLLELASKTEWSEEDENILQWIVTDIKQLKNYNKKSDAIVNKEFALLESIKQRYTWKPSGEQLYVLHWLATNVLGDGVVDKKASEILYTLYDDLKKL